MQVSTSRITTSVAVAVVLGVALSGCGGGGGAPVVGAPTVAPPEVRLPAGHGLSAGEITVAAGVSEEHGNVVVTCPAGGGACVLRVSADGTAEYDRTGGIPGVTPALAAWELPRGSRAPGWRDHGGGGCDGAARERGGDVSGWRRCVRAARVGGRDGDV